MTIAEKQQELAAYRLNQADESLSEARLLFIGGQSVRSVVNRLYYSMFYAVLALLVFGSYSSSKHTGVLSYFNRTFVKPGIFPLHLGRAFSLAFDLRNRGDYKENVEIPKEKAEGLLLLAEEFVAHTRTVLAAEGRIPTMTHGGTG